MIKIFYKNFFAILIDYKIAAIPSMTHFLFHKGNGITILPVDISLKTELPNSIKIYKDKEILE